MRRAAQRPTEKSAACWSGPLLLGLQRLRIELRPTTAGCRGTLTGAGTARSRASTRPGTPEERLEILGFVSTSELSWIHLHRPYYLSSPDENTRLYTVLREILVRSDRLAVGQLVLRRRRQLVAIYGYRGALVVHLLRASTDIVDPRELGLATANAGDERQWSHGPWQTPMPAATPPVERDTRLTPVTHDGPAAIATEVGGVRVLDFTEALKRRRELGTLASDTPPRQPQRAGPAPALHRRRSPARGSR